MNSGNNYEVSVLEFEGENHDEFRRQMISSAKQVLENFPDLIQKFLDLFKSVYPPHILSCFSAYSLRQYVGANGVEPRSSLKEIQQHHCEFLQALLLTLPIEEWGNDPITPEVNQMMFDLAPELSTAIMSESIASTPENLNEEELAIRGLQQRVKLHTQGVRNWGYFHDVVQMSRELLSPMNDHFKDAYGFTGDELIDVLHTIVSEYEKRQNRHFTMLRKVARGKNYRQVIRLYFKHMPDIEGDPEEMIERLPNDLTKEQGLGIVMAHSDLWIADSATFNAAQISQACGIGKDEIAAVLKAISFKPAGLMGKKVEYFFLANPVWDRPGIQLSDCDFLFTIPQIAFSHISRIIDRLASEGNFKKQLEKRRSDFLEEKLLRIISRALPTAEIKSSAKWKVGPEQFETDLLVIQDRLVLIGEAKSHRLTPEGLRGAPKRVKRHIEDLIVSPSLQSERLEQLINDAKSGDQDAIDIVSELGIQPERVDNVIRFSTTLDDFSVLSAAEGEFKKIGWLPEEHQLAPTILISDLSCIVEILDNPLLFYHYMKERSHFQKSFTVLGDELDFLGLYLESCFNLAGLQKQKMRFTPSGMSAPIDRYFESKAIGKIIPKPKVSLGTYFRKVVDRLGETQPEGWTSIGMHLLCSADPAEQKKVDKAISKIKGIVRREYRDPNHICTIQIQPPEARKARVVLYFHPKQLEGQSRQMAQNLLGEAMEDPNVSTCALISQNIDNKHSPFEFAALATTAGE